MDTVKNKKEVNTLFLVDDEMSFHLVIEDTLDLNDFDVELKSCHTSEEAIQTFRGYVKENNKPDLVLIDYNLKGSSMNGAELINHINTVEGNGVIIGIISTSSEKSEIETARNFGANFWVVKSADLDDRIIALRKYFFEDNLKDFKIFD